MTKLSSWLSAYVVVIFDTVSCFYFVAVWYNVL